MVEKATVEQWIREFGLEADSIELENEEDFAWVLSFQGQAFRTVVAHPKVESNHLIMQVDVLISEPHVEALKAVGEETRTRFTYDLRIALLQQPVGYALDIDKESGILKQMTFGYNLLEDPLQKAGFFRRSHQLQSAGMLAAEMLKKLAQFQRW